MFFFLELLKEEKELAVEKHEFDFSDCYIVRLGSLDLELLHFCIAKKLAHFRLVGLILGLNKDQYRSLKR